VRFSAMYLVFCSLGKYRRRQNRSKEWQAPHARVHNGVRIRRLGHGNDKASMKGPGERHVLIYCAVSRISSFECAKFTITLLVGQSEEPCMFAIQ
jgi:hypothetical protein